jgi:hypothetical protein
MTAQRFYIGKKDIEDIAEDLEMWIADRVPPAPSGTRCEHDPCYGQEDGEEFDEGGTAMRPLATSFVYRIEGDHVCYTWVCETCSAHANESYLADLDSFPTTSGGYAVTPRHCS